MRGLLVKAYHENERYSIADRIDEAPPHCTVEVATVTAQPTHRLGIPGVKACARTRRVNFASNPGKRKYSGLSCRSNFKAQKVSGNTIHFRSRLCYEAVPNKKREFS
ncbi:uncharacterized protein CIMG_04577 [Coccidioides immitis RS]|uniref:Uncharacterized protein n=3 Tax=Coccidioides immitis TaxID=5501 RepID=J3KDT2_COCIM|nr:uncharacterized protein CIMG_04577 [Coccidioides immitis RS]EAS33553.3 hypothetical protein CIMG_04577 [Coccidioides immitis RS]KMP04730.1 hypothetical protein CIRG_04411 [Coccidioides immitis RMSCC 2394]KMU77496.1 hypothetical protein CISG_06498 [Coccidioides immitis RMSCC 3703]